MRLKQMLQECIPPAYYSNGNQAKCMWYRVFNMFDTDPDSYIVESKKKGMENKTTITESYEGSGELDQSSSKEQDQN